MTIAERVAWHVACLVCISIGVVAIGVLGNVVAAVMWIAIGLVCVGKAMFG